MALWTTSDSLARLVRLAMNSCKDGKQPDGFKMEKKKLKVPEKRYVSSAETLASVQDEEEPGQCRLADDEVQNDEGQGREVNVKDKKPLPVAPSMNRDRLDKLRLDVWGMIEDLCPENVLGNVQWGYCGNVLPLWCTNYKAQNLFFLDKKEQISRKQCYITLLPLLYLTQFCCPLFFVRQITFENF